MTRTCRFSAIDHITLIVSDIEKTRQFYCEILGMFEVPRPKFDFEGLWLHPSQPQPGELVRAMIHATLEGKGAGKAGWGDRQVERISRGHHFAFQVDDAIEFSEFLQGKGVSIAVGPNKRPDGPTQFFIRDPDDHLIEFFSMD